MTIGWTRLDRICGLPSSPSTWWALKCFIACYIVEVEIQLQSRFVSFYFRMKCYEFGRNDDDYFLKCVFSGAHVLFLYGSERFLTLRTAGHQEVPDMGFRPGQHWIFVWFRSLRVELPAVLVQFCSRSTMDLHRVIWILAGTQLSGVSCSIYSLCSCNTRTQFSWQNTNLN